MPRAIWNGQVLAESDERVLLDVDGEQPGMLPATFECLPGAIRIKGRPATAATS